MVAILSQPSYWKWNQLKVDIGYNWAIMMIDMVISMLLFGFVAANLHLIVQFYCTTSAKHHFVY